MHYLLYWGAGSFLMFCPFLREFCESDHKEMLKSVLRMHLQSKNEINYGTIGYST